ncbi:MAG: phosphate acyltransferase PlsX [Ruminococcus sp.]|jgi:glycerol-3-phosphate acyltransferase PlsX|nr:phosphate acyltransferase PlsX [Ruminococcus sp.]
MRIVVDAFGGDNAPIEVIKGAERAVRELDVDIVLVGDKEKIRHIAREQGIPLEGFHVIHTDSVFDIHEEPTKILKEYKDCSMAMGLRALAEGKGDAFVSAGSTGALTVGGTFIAKRLKGIKRPALAPLLPSDKGSFMLLDAGANTECRPEMVVTFALMGAAYMEAVGGIFTPKVGLLNIGTEETKGRPVDVETYKLLQSAPIEFYGNVEARELPLGECDVVVCDGFTGNIALKLYEGMGKYFGNTLKGMLKGFPGTLAGALILKKIKAFRKKMDYKEVGGAVLLGVSKPVIKAHGSSDETAFYNAIRQAKLCVDGDIIGKITEKLTSDGNN